MVGVILLGVGIVVLYTIMTHHVKSNPLGAEAGCVIWIGVGIFLIVKGMNGNKTS